MTSRITIAGMHGRAWCDSQREALRLYFGSLARLTDCEYVVFVDDPPDWLRHEAWMSNVELIEHSVPKNQYDPEFHNSCRRDLVKLIEERGRDKTYIHTCARDAYFQRDVPYLTPGLHLIEEGMRYKDCDWNTKAMNRFDPDFLRGRPSARVINGGQLFGSGDDLIKLFDVESRLGFQAKGCTNQTAIGWAYHRGLFPATLHDPHKDDLCLTGQAVRLGCIKTDRRNGAYYSPLGMPFVLIHQYDRIPAEVAV